jgi:hypothetical protein
MRNQSTRRVIRLEKRELAEIPPQASLVERGRRLWRLLCEKGIDPSRLYSVEYYPYRRCWLLTQEIERGPQRLPSAGAPPEEASRMFSLQLSTELRRTALAAFAALAARSAQFARFGCDYQLPPKPQETTPAELARLLGGRIEADVQVHFTSEGGWEADPA